MPNLIFAASVLSGVVGTALYIRNKEDKYSWLFLMLGELSAMWAIYSLLWSV